MHIYNIAWGVQEMQVRSMILSVSDFQTELQTPCSGVAFSKCVSDPSHVLVMFQILFTGSCPGSPSRWCHRSCARGYVALLANQKKPNQSCFIDILFPVLPRSYTLHMREQRPSAPYPRPSLTLSPPPSPLDKPTIAPHAHALIESLFFGVFEARLINVRPTGREDIIYLFIT